MKKVFPLIIFLLLLCLFVFTRFYKLPETLYFWGDIGRDHEMLIEMVQNRRPILLGPSNSELPFNQSAWYYYLNLPVFILSGYSAYTTAITGIILTISAFLYSAWRLKSLQKSSLFLLLFTFQPIFLAQQRSTWNPAFALPFLIIIFSLLWEILSQRKASKTDLILFSFSLCFSVAMTYAVVPIVFLCIITAFGFLPQKQRLSFILWLTLGATMAFLPHLLFEARHNFLLTQQLLQTSAESKSWMPLIEKITVGFFSLFGFLQTSTHLAQKIGITFLLVLMGINISRQPQKKKKIIFLIIGALGFFISTFLVSQFHSHYSLGFGLLILFLISQLPNWWGRGVAGLLILLWIPFLSTPFLQKPHRTVADLETCARNFCSQNKEPLYVAAQAWHDFHNGYDYSFFMNKNGCRTRDIGTNPGYSTAMAVVVDKAAFDPESSSFYELSLFGEKKIANKYVCKEDLAIFFFSKKD